MDDLPQDCVDISDTIYGIFVVVPEVEIVWDLVGFSPLDLFLVVSVLYSTDRQKP